MAEGDAEHRLIRPASAHVVHSFEAANNTARDALPLTANDVGRVVKSGGSFYLLESVGPLVWQLLKTPPAPGVVLSDAAPSDIVSATADPGDGEEAARWNHKHKHGAQAGGALHALATAAIAGFMSPAAFAAVVPLYTAAAAVHVYVTTTGNDANAGTIAAPKRTIAGAWALLPSVQTAPFTVHLASGTHDWTPPPDSLVQVGARACITVIGDGAGQAGDDGHTVIGSGTVAAGSTATAVNISETITAAARRGMTFEITSGANMGDRRHITANTTGQVSLSNALQSVTTGQTYRVTRPAVLINMAAPDTSTRMLLARCDLLNLVNVRTRGGIAEMLACDFLSLFGVELESHLFVSETTLAGASASNLLRAHRVGNTLAYFAAWTAAAGLTLTAAQWNGWGLAATTATPVGSQFQGIGFANGSRFEGFLTMPMVSVGPGATNIVVGLMGGAIGALSTLNVGQKYNVLGAFTIGQGGGLDGNTVLSLTYDGELIGGGALTVQSSHASNLATISQHSRMLLLGGLALISESTGSTTCLQVNDDAEVVLGATTCSSGSAPRQFEVNGNAALLGTTWNGNQGGPNPSTVRQNGRAAFSSIVVGAVLVRDSGRLSGAINAQGVGGVVVNGAGACVTSSNFTARNTSTGAAADGVRLQGGGALWCETSAVNITTAGSSGYAVNCRGGGRFYCAAQPTAAVGPTADFSVGSGTGEDFPDTDLTAVYASRSAGGSLVQRTA